MLTDEALENTVCRTRCGRVYGPVGIHNTCRCRGLSWYHTFW